MVCFIKQVPNDSSSKSTFFSRTSTASSSCRDNYAASTVQALRVVSSWRCPSDHECSVRWLSVMHSSSSHLLHAPQSSSTSTPCPTASTPLKLHRYHQTSSLHLKKTRVPFSHVSQTGPSPPSPPPVASGYALSPSSSSSSPSPPSPSSTTKSQALRP